jgi:outer membrane protein
LQGRIQEFQQNSERDFEQKQHRLFAPIMEKATNAINEVAKENNYSYIFDTAAGTLLFANESDDILELVKRKLNLR